MRISIALVTYNGEKYINKQLESLFEQNILPDELIIVDDCSNDKTVELIKHFKSIAPFEVKLFQNTINIGVSKNFGKAISLCTGDLIFLCDQDDFWYKNKIEFVYDFYKNNPNILLIINDGLLTDGNLNPTNLTQGQQILNTGSNINQLINGCFSAINKKLVPLILPIDFNYPLYDNFIHRLSSLLDGKVYLNNPLQYYRRHESNTSSNFASSLKKISKWDAKKLFFKENTHDYLFNELLVLNRINNRLIDFNNNNCDFVFKNQIELALIKIKHEQYIIRKRLKIVSNKYFIIRSFLAVFFYLKGGYKLFSGFNSCIKDIIKKV